MSSSKKVKVRKFPLSVSLLFLFSGEISHNLTAKFATNSTINFLSVYFSLLSKSNFSLTVSLSDSLTVNQPGLMFSTVILA